MMHTPVILALAILAQEKPDHPDNPIFRALLAEGLTSGGVTVKLPDPTLRDGLDESGVKSALKAMAGDDRGVRDFLRDSVTAPHVLKLRDVKAGDSTIRVAELWFVVHAKLDEIDPDKALKGSDARSAEAGNMRFETRLLSDSEIRDRKLDPLSPLEGRKEWRAHLNGRLLDRIEVDATDHAVLTRSAESIVVATRTDRAFDADPKSPNRWSTLVKAGDVEKPGPPHPYPGGISYAKITRLAGEPDALMVESHLAFVEPVDWFQGNPILRSKLGIVAQDQVRRLRREIEAGRKGGRKSR